MLRNKTRSKALGALFIAMNSDIGIAITDVVSTSENQIEHAENINGKLNRIINEIKASTAEFINPLFDKCHDKSHDKADLSGSIGGGIGDTLGGGFSKEYSKDTNC